MVPGRAVGIRGAAGTAADPVPERRRRAAQHANGDRSTARDRAVGRVAALIFADVVKPAARVLTVEARVPGRVLLQKIVADVLADVARVARPGCRTASVARTC